MGQEKEDTPLKIMLAGFQNTHSCFIAGITSTIFSCSSDYSVDFLYFKKFGNAVWKRSAYPIHVNSKILQMQFFLLREKAGKTRQYLWFISSSYTKISWSHRSCSFPQNKLSSIELLSW